MNVPSAAAASLQPPLSRNGLPPGVHFIQRDWLSSNQVLLCDSDPQRWAQECAPDQAPHDYTLIDTSYVKHQHTTLALLRHQIGAGRLRRIINTHLHSDHCGGNALLSTTWDCEVLVPRASLEDVNRWDAVALSHAGTGQDCPPFRATGSLQPGDAFVAGGLEWQVHAAPGHDHKSLLFFAPAQGLLVSADALWENGFGILFPALEGESAFDEQDSVLDLIESLRPQRVLPGHGAMFTDVAKALATARSRLKAMRDKPERNARNALKALIKFKILDVEVMTIEHFLRDYARTSVNRAAARQLGQPAEVLLHQALLELHEAGQVRIEGDVFYNREVS